MGPVTRMTLSTEQVLRVVLRCNERETYGLKISAAVGLPSGTVQPILSRLESIGWLQSRWEDVEPQIVGRARRRYFVLTPDGREGAQSALSRTSARRSRQLSRSSFANGNPT